MRSGRSEPGRITLVVGAAGTPTMSPVAISGMKAGETGVVDLAGYLRSSLPVPAPTVVSVQPLRGGEVTVTPAGGSQVRIGTGAGAHGLAEFRVTMSDSPDGGAARQASNVLSVDVLGVPSTPAAPVPGNQTLSGQVRLSWRAPDANGAPIDRYEVRSDAGRTYHCASTQCDIPGLENGRRYTFQVRAHNAVGWSDLSPRSRTAVPDARPGPVSDVRMVKQGDTWLDIAWRPPTTRTSDIDHYVVTWSGGGRAEPPGPYVHVTELKNTREYRFRIVAVNKVGPGEAVTSAPFQPQGDPEAPSRPRIQVGDPVGNTVDLVLTWNRVDPHGPGQVTYDVLDGGRVEDLCQGRSETVCSIPNVALDGSKHEYAVRAVVGKGNVSTGDATEWRAVLPPGDWADWTIKPKGSATDALASFTVPPSRGTQSDVTVYVDGHATDSFRATGTLTDKTITMPDNDRPHDVRLQVCNEQALCTESATKTVQTWGGLRATMITLTPHQDGPTTVSWTVEVDSNGAPARVTVDSAFRSTGPFTTTDPNITTYELAPVDIGWDTTEELTVTLDDPAKNRGPATRSESFTTDKQPPPVVLVKKGPACNDSPGSDTPCNVDGQGEDCTDASCAFIRLVTSDFGSPVECRVDTQDWGQPVDLAPIPDDASTVTALYFGNPGRWVRANCTDQATNRRNDNDQIDW
ncbi:MAG: fibronectin type III domain-containing protein [Nocardioides sp.]